MELMNFRKFQQVTSKQLAYFHSTELKWQNYSNKPTNICTSESLIKMYN